MMSVGNDLMIEFADKVITITDQDELESYVNGEAVLKCTQCGSEMKVKVEKEEEKLVECNNCSLIYMVQLKTY